jgi:hypothetical protein
MHTGREEEIFQKSTNLKILADRRAKSRSFHIKNPQIKGATADN